MCQAAAKAQCYQALSTLLQYCTLGSLRQFLLELALELLQCSLPVHQWLSMRSYCHLLQHVCSPTLPAGACQLSIDSNSIDSNIQRQQQDMASGKQTARISTGGAAPRNIKKLIAEQHMTPAATITGPTASSCNTSMYVILRSHVTAVADPDEEKLDDAEWEEWGNKYDLQETEAKVLPDHVLPKLGL